MEYEVAMTTDLPLPDRLARRIADLLEDEPEEITISVISTQRTGAVLQVMTTDGELVVTVSAAPQELEPCPLCGGMTEIKTEIENTFMLWRVVCCVCGVGMRWYASRRAAARAWNRNAEKER